MRIKIDHIAKIEGHASFVGEIISGKTISARMQINEGARLIEGILVDRKYDEAPVITARICGVCPVAHILTSLKALEDALSINPNKEIKILRKLMMMGQIINSHALHLFFFSLSDFFEFSSDAKLLKKYPTLAQDALLLRAFGNKIIEVIGGRNIHPMNPIVGGFGKYTNKKELNKILKEDYLPALKAGIRFVKFTINLKYPEFKREMDFISLTNPEEYCFYEGDLKTSDGKIHKDKDFLNIIKEIQDVQSVAKRSHWQGKSYMVGALARLNFNIDKLNPKTQALLKTKKLQFPIKNPFYNIFAQAIEILHCIEESEKLIKLFLETDEKEHNNIEYQLKAGKGTGAIEVPRGTLYHQYELNDKGFITNCNIITPTAQNLASIETDLEEWLPELAKLKEKERKNKIRMLVRAYDPCITCATH